VTRAKQLEPIGNASAGCTKPLFSTVPLFPGEAPPIKSSSFHFHFIHTVHSDALGNNAKTLCQIQLIQQTARLNLRETWTLMTAHLHP
jgi:hypothetical protein